MDPREAASGSGALAHAAAVGAGRVCRFFFVVSLAWLAPGALAGVAPAFVVLHLAEALLQALGGARVRIEGRGGRRARAGKSGRLAPLVLLLGAGAAVAACAAGLLAVLARDAGPDAARALRLAALVPVVTLVREVAWSSAALARAGSRRPARPTVLIEPLALLAAGGALAALEGPSPAAFAAAWLASALLGAAVSAGSAIRARGAAAARAAEPEPSGAQPTEPARTTARRFLGVAAAIAAGEVGDRIARHAAILLAAVTLDHAVVAALVVAQHAVLPVEVVPVAIRRGTLAVRSGGRGRLAARCAAARRRSLVAGVPLLAALALAAGPISALVAPAVAGVAGSIAAFAIGAAAALAFGPSRPLLLRRGTRRALRWTLAAHAAGLAVAGLGIALGPGSAPAAAASAAAGFVVSQAVLHAGARRPGDEDERRLARARRRARAAARLEAIA